MSISKRSFGTYEGKEVFSFALDNNKGLSAEIINYGGIIRSLVFNGTDVVLGRDSLEEYLKNAGYFGALIGRNSNRIARSEFELGGRTYKLNSNDGLNNLHGGIKGFNARVWDYEVKDSPEPALILTLLSEDGEEGFPGNANIKVTYTLTNDNSICIHYEALCDQDTVINITNHSYFNLNGHDSGTVDGHLLWLDSSFFTPNDSECMPTGEVIKTEGTPFDFKNPKKLSEGFTSDHEQIKLFGGYDHNFALNGRGMRLCGRLRGDKTGIIMEMSTDMSGVQLYTGNSIEDHRICKGGSQYPVHGALCLETQAFPNSLRFSHFPNGILKKGEKYDSVTSYKFMK